MKLRILSGAEVALALPMPRAIEAMRRAFAQLSAGAANVPLRTRLTTDRGVTLLMPAHLKETGECCVKIVSVYPNNAERGLPVIMGVAVALDAETGRPLALMESDALTAIRTGAAGGLSAELLARADARQVAVIGAGVQGRAVLRGVMTVRPIEEARIFSRTEASAQCMAEEAASWETIGQVGQVRQVRQVRPVRSPSEAVRGADIVIAATTSSTPVFDGADLKPGTHVIGVGSYSRTMQEVDAATVRRARVVVDSREACLAEAGDIVMSGATIDAELGEIVAGVKPGRESEDEITFFKSVGNAAQDAAAAAEVLVAAEREGLGRVVEI